LSKRRVPPKRHEPCKPPLHGTCSRGINTPYSSMKALVYPLNLSFLNSSDRGSSPQKEKNRSRVPAKPEPSERRHSRSPAGPQPSASAASVISHVLARLRMYRRYALFHLSPPPVVNSPMPAAKAPPVARSPSGNIRSLRRRSDLPSCTSC
jgi:hypothetical protein